MVPVSSPKEDRLLVNLEIVLENLIQIDVSDSSLVVKFTFLTSWIDKRVEFANLQPGTNILDPEEWSTMWTPDFLVKETDRYMVTSRLPEERYSRVYVENLDDSNFTSEYNNMTNNFFYSGSNVKIFKRNNHAINFQCNFNWRLYPFDTQVRVSFRCISLYEVDMKDRMCNFRNVH